MGGINGEEISVRVSVAWYKSIWEQPGWEGHSPVVLGSPWCPQATVQVLGAVGDAALSQLEALQRIQVARVFDVYEMLSALQEVRDRLSQQVRAWLQVPLLTPSWGHPPCSFGTLKNTACHCTGCIRPAGGELHGTFEDGVDRLGLGRDPPAAGRQAVRG